MNICYLKFRLKILSITLIIIMFDNFDVKKQLQTKDLITLFNKIPQLRPKFNQS